MPDMQYAQVGVQSVNLHRAFGAASFSCVCRTFLVSRKGSAMSFLVIDDKLKFFKCIRVG